MSAKLLLVEDHEDSRNVLARLLTLHGYDVACAASGGEAVKLASTSPFDLVLMDHQLPDADGCSVMKKLHAELKLEGIALTANAYPADKRHSEDAGFRAHLTKPIDAAKLCAVIDAELAKKSVS